MLTRTAAWILAGAALLLWGCSSGGAKIPTGTRVYPSVAQGGVLPIQVIRRGTTISLTNTSAHAFGASVVWVNRRYSRPIAGFKLGETLVLELSEFRDEYGEPFPAGGFFARETPAKVVLTQIESAGEDGAQALTGLVTIGQEVE